MWTAALFTIAKLWNQPRGLSMKKMWYAYTIEYYSVIKNEIMSFAGKWMKPENIILSEICQTKKKITCSLYVNTVLKKMNNRSKRKTGSGNQQGRGMKRKSKKRVNMTKVVLKGGEG
jgi:hypothetical protein